MKTMPFLRCRSFACRPRPMLKSALTIFGLLAVFAVFPARADDLADVTKAVRAGQYAEALTKADTFLSKHPRDPQMRFLKGVILTEQNKAPEAIAVFTKLTEDFPELPEPYNNLAVLFFSSGQYDKARIVLDAAIRTNPAYATAYENLGDVHAKLASQAYDKALQLDSGNSAAKSKLTLLRTLASNGAGAPKVSNAAAGVAANSPPAVVAAQAKPAAPEPTKPVTVASVTSSTVAVKAEPEPKPASKASAENNDNAEILSAVRGWAKAWSAQDVKAYLNFYAGDFAPPKGETRSAWAEERRQRIEGKNQIEVKIESPQISVNGNTATVRFRQIYASNRLQADSRKMLVLTRQGGRWQIKQERAGS